MHLPKFISFSNDLKSTALNANSQAGHAYLNAITTRHLRDGAFGALTSKLLQ